MTVEPTPLPPRVVASDQFRLKVGLTWVVLAGLLCAAFYGLHLDLGFVAGKLPFLLGLKLAPNGFIQGAALTIFVTACSMVCALGVALITALGRMSKNPVAFALATFYASLFRGLTQGAEVSAKRQALELTLVGAENRLGHIMNAYDVADAPAGFLAKWESTFFKLTGVSSVIDN